MTTQTTAPPIMERLRAETRPQHVATEAIPFSSAIVAETLPRAGYVAQLAAYLPVYEALEAAVADLGDPDLRSVWEPEMRRAHLLRLDLQALGATPSDLPVATRAAAASFAAWIDRLRETPDALLGVLYVLEGSTLGGALLRRHLAGAFGLDDDGLRYYSPYGNHPKPHWVAFSARMNAAVSREDGAELVIDAARETFVRIGEILTSIGEAAGTGQGRVAGSMAMAGTRASH